MSKYRFKVSNSEGVADEMLANAANDDAAKLQAIRFAGELLSQATDEVTDCQWVCIEVRISNAMKLAVLVELDEAPKDPGRVSGPASSPPAPGHATDRMAGAR